MSWLFTDTIDLIRAARAGDQLARDTVAARYRAPLLERIRLMMGVTARRAPSRRTSSKGCSSRSFATSTRCEV
jgi:hypothetical protein